MLHYQNKTTGELITNHNTAMEWYRAGDEVALLDFSETLGEWVERGYWAH